MKKADILENAVTEEEYSLSELQHWLQYGKHSWWMGVAVFWLPYGPILFVLKIIALVFTPYMLYHLYKAKWYKSVVVFLIVVLLPFLVTRIIDTGHYILDFLLPFLPLLTFFFFVYIISYMIGVRLNEIRTRKKWKREEMLRN